MGETITGLTDDDIQTGWKQETASDTADDDATDPDAADTADDDATDPDAADTADEADDTDPTDGDVDQTDA